MRFPLELAITYRRVESGSGANWTISESLNISSTGLLFRTAEGFQPGQTVEASIHWPLCLDNRVPLKLIIKGHIVRTERDNTAMRFENYEFKTRCAPQPVQDTI